RGRRSDAGVWKVGSRCSRESTSSILAVGMTKQREGTEGEIASGHDEKKEKWMKTPDCRSERCYRMSRRDASTSSLPLMERRRRRRSRQWIWNAFWFGPHLDLVGSDPSEHGRWPWEADGPREVRWRRRQHPVGPAIRMVIGARLHRRPRNAGGFRERGRCGDEGEAEAGGGRECSGRHVKGPEDGCFETTGDFTGAVDYADVSNPPMILLEAFRETVAMFRWLQAGGEGT
ncbi:hypothetical protein BHE74_00056368, partial [Ensete ventricosum]